MPIREPSYRVLNARREGGRAARGFHRVGLVLGGITLALGLIFVAAALFGGSGFPGGAWWLLLLAIAFGPAVAIYLIARLLGWMLSGFGRQ